MPCFVYSRSLCGFIADASFESEMDCKFIGCTRDLGYSGPTEKGMDPTFHSIDSEPLAA